MSVHITKAKKSTGHCLNNVTRASNKCYALDLNATKW